MAGSAHSSELQQSQHDAERTATGAATVPDRLGGTQLNSIFLAHQHQRPATADAAPGNHSRYAGQHVKHWETCRASSSINVLAVALAGSIPPCWLSRYP